MLDEILSSALRVAGPRAAAALSDPLRRRMILLLAAKTLSVVELARRLDLDLRRVHYHLTQLVSLGLVEVVGERRRGGRPIKLYRAVAPAFFVPDEVAPARSSTALRDELEAALARAHDPEREGVLYFVGDEGPRMRPVRSTGRGPAATETWRVLRLTRVEAARLAEDIDARLRASEGSGEPYLIHFAMAPRRP
jgi:DNA-binding transcriptional ArsR family regulator